MSAPSITGNLTITILNSEYYHWTGDVISSSLTSDHTDTVIPCAEWVTIANTHGESYHFRGNGIQRLSSLVSDALRASLLIWGDSPGLRTEALASEIRLLNEIHSFIVGDE